MTISIFEIEAAKKEAAAEAEQLEYLQRVIADNVALTEENKQLSEDLSAANRKLKFAETWIEENEGGRDFKLYLDNVKDNQNDRIKKFTKQAPIVNGVDDLPSY